MPRRPSGRADKAQRRGRAYSWILTLLFMLLAAGHTLLVAAWTGETRIEINSVTATARREQEQDW